jgi:hypothetical protein
MALVQGIYDLGKPGREQTLYTNRLADAALIQENFVSTGQSRNAITFTKFTFMKSVYETPGFMNPVSHAVSHAVSDAKRA